MKHMQTEHVHETWHCDMCDESLEFESPQDFASHLHSQHATTLSTEELRVVSQFAASRESIIVDCCVICGWSPPIGEFQALADLQPVMFKHMAVEHMQKLALLSLPWTDNPGGSLTMTALSVSSRTSNEDDDYRCRLLQDPNLDPRGHRETEVELSGIEPTELSSIAQAFGQPEHDLNHVRSWLARTYPSEIKQEDTDDVMVPNIVGLSLDRHLSQPDSIAKKSPSITHSENSASSADLAKAFTPAELLWHSDVIAWLKVEASSPHHIADAIMPYLMTLSSWYLLYSAALTSLQGIQEAHGSPLLWLHGPPGCGKTTFAWAVREIRQSSFRRARMTTLFYCFHPDRSMDDALRSLIYQIRQQIDALPSLEDLYSSCASRRRRPKGAPDYRQPTTRELARCFKDTVAYSQHYFDIYLDSVDTCASTTDINFEEWLRELADNNRENVRIIVTSRDAPVINTQKCSKTGDQTVLSIRLPKRRGDTSPYIHKVLRKDKFLHK
jgi:hypothetical protein